MKAIDGQFAGRYPTPQRTTPTVAQARASKVPTATPEVQAPARQSHSGDARPVRIGRGGDSQAIFAYTRHAQTASMQVKSSIDEYV